MKRILEEVTSAVLVLLLLVKFATSADVVVVAVTNSSDRYESPAAQSNTRTNDERHNESEQPDQPCNATQNAISLQQKKDARIRIIRDRERWRLTLLVRFWELSRRSTTANSLDSVDLGGFESLLEEENGRNDREPSELTTYVYLPQCSGPHNFVGEWNDSTNFRLYFKMESLQTSYRLREITVNSAFLYIKKKSSLVFGNHRPALTSARTGRQRVTGSDAGSGSSGRASSLRRRPTRDTEISASSSNASSFSSSSNASSSSSTFSRSDAGGGAISNLKIVVNSFISRNRKNRQEMRQVASTPVSRQSTEWVRINLTQVVDDWLKRPSRNLGLQVTLRSSALPSSTELNPHDYFNGVNCSFTAQTGQSPSNHLWSPEDSVGQSSVDWTSAHLENITHPFLEVVTVQVPRSRPRHRRHAQSEHRFEVPSHEVDRDKSSTLRKWMQSMRSIDAESSSSQTQHLSTASDSVFPFVA